MIQIEFNQQTTVLEQQILAVIEGKELAVVHEALMLVLHRTLDTNGFIALLSSCKTA
jgi:hypothetical protein